MSTLNALANTQPCCPVCKSIYWHEAGSCGKSYSDALIADGMTLSDVLNELGFGMDHDCGNIVLERDDLTTITINCEPLVWDWLRKEGLIR